jgi:hypothetical protein
VSDVLVEPNSKSIDTNANDSDDLDDGKDSGSGSVSVDDLEKYAVRRRYYTKSLVRLEHNLHVVHPSVRSVTQLGQTMLGGIQLIDFKALQCV